RGYGANVIVAPVGDARTLPLSTVVRAEALGVTAAPFLYTVGSLQGEPVVVAGVDFRRAAPLIGYWHAPAPGTGECLAGTAAAEPFHLTPGAKAELDSGPCLVRAILSTGGPEDAQIVVPFAGDVASLIQVRADGERLPELRAALANALPEGEVRL